MHWLGEIWRRVGLLLRLGEATRELDEEMRLHREMKERELVAGGVPADEARYAAARALGNAAALHERGKDAWGWRWLEDFLQDLRFGARMLRKNLGFTAVAVLTLALGIGANTAIFTLVHAVMLRSLPVVNPSQLYRLGDNDNCCVWGGFQPDFGIFSHPLYRHLREENPEFEMMAAFEAAPHQFWRAAGRRIDNGGIVGWRIRFRQLLFDVRGRCIRRPGACSRRRCKGSGAGSGRQLQGLEGTLRTGSVCSRRAVGHKRRAIYSGWDRPAWILRRHASQRSAGFVPSPLAGTGGTR